MTSQWYSFGMSTLTEVMALDEYCLWDVFCVWTACTAVLKLSLARIRIS